ncbi:hypothetical protein [Saccharicrinis sp. 156]|uniref:hypothetical protein n=1 Tax=Saccharicrinis sp. 156 TaxID=3417574 RepID=UPI003D353EC8
MKKSASFTGKEMDHISLDFSKLREEGLEYIQKLSGDIWTDYNSHDPGVTILEQLCYAITDLAFRTSLPIKDLLTISDHEKVEYDAAACDNELEGEDVKIDLQKNAFYSPSSILSSYPVTIEDTRKMIINRFEEIRNVWFDCKKNVGYEEQVIGINQIEMMPTLSFQELINSNPKEKEAFLSDVNRFLCENRNLGEKYEQAILLEPHLIDIEFSVYLNAQVEVETTIANLFLRMLEFIYSPVRFNSLHEITEAGFGLEEAFSGPVPSRGFIKPGTLTDRLKIIHIDEIQKIFAKADGIQKCEVEPFKADGTDGLKMEVDKGKYFHVLIKDNSDDGFDHRFNNIYKNMTVYVNNKKLHVLNKQKINNSFMGKWAKQYRGYPIGKSIKTLFLKKLRGQFQNPTQYHSIQNHFPTIYGIGNEGLSKNETEDRKAKALQLKTYLMLFEQHLANHLSQLGNLNTFFNINFNKNQQITYFTQWLHSVPQIQDMGLYRGDVTEQKLNLEAKETFYDRKNRIYNHLLARFGEEFNDIPWKVASLLNMLPNDDIFNETLLDKKSFYLKNLKSLSYFRTRGEFFNREENDTYTWKHSGLEDILMAKTGIPYRGNTTLVPELKKLTQSASQLPEFNTILNTSDLINDFGPLTKSQLNITDLITGPDSIPAYFFKKLPLNDLYKRTVNFENFLISNHQSDKESVNVLFQPEKDKWVSVFTAPTRQSAIQLINEIISYFISLNKKSEGIYLVDHILLNNILKDSKFGFKFIDEEGQHLFQTVEEESWYRTEDERNEVFIHHNFTLENYCYENKTWSIKTKDWTFYPVLKNHPKLIQLEDELESGSRYSYINGSWFIKYEDARTPREVRKVKHLESLNKALEEIYNSTKKYTSQICLARDRSFYSFSGSRWIIKYQDRLLASQKIDQEDMISITGILKNWAYKFKDGKWELESGVRIPDDQNRNNLNILNALFEKVYHANRSIVQLFNTPENENGRLRYKEMEKIRLASYPQNTNKKSGQRRLVFQRKLPNGKIIDEDFFNMKISVMLPDWPARFQDDQFKSYFSDLLLERIPTHISNQIYWLDKHQMEVFEEKYHNWQNLRLASQNTEKSSKKIYSASLRLYETIINLEIN